MSLFASVSAKADLIQTFDAVPATYTPGTPFEFQLRLPGVRDLSLYNLELVFATSAPATAISAAFTPAPAPGTYPFPTQDFFASAAGVFNGSYRLTLSDFLLDPSGVNTVAGINDLLGTVRVTPSADVSGPIQISFDPSSLQLDDSAGRPIDATFPNPVIAQEAKVNQSPAPAGVALAFSDGVMLIVRKRVSSANCHARNTRA